MNKEDLDYFNPEFWKEYDRKNKRKRKSYFSNKYPNKHASVRAAIHLASPNRGDKVWENDFILRISIGTLINKRIGFIPENKIQMLVDDDRNIILRNVYDFEKGFKANFDPLGTISIVKRVPDILCYPHLVKFKRPILKDKVPIEYGAKNLVEYKVYENRGIIIFTIQDNGNELPYTSINNDDIDERNK